MLLFKNNLVMNVTLCESMLKTFSLVTAQWPLFHDLREKYWTMFSL